MPIPFDLDLPIYLWATANVLFNSKTKLRKNTRPIPVQFEMEEVPENELTAAQREYLKPFDEQLARLNYRPLCTFRAKNYGTNLMRRYLNPADPASCALTIVEVRVKTGAITSVKNSSHVEFTTRFSGSKSLTTRNMAHKSLFDQPDYRTIQDLPNITNLAELKKRHDAQARSLGVPETPPQNSDSVLAEVQSEHDRYSKFQLGQGIYRLAPTGGAYEVTEKVFNRGIRNHFLPFGRRVSPTPLIFSALVGAVLPLVGILKIAPWMTMQEHLQNAAFPGARLAIFLCYCLAGAIIGYFCEIQNSSWLMLVTYLPAHLVAGWTFGWLPYSTIAHLSAFYFSQARRKRKMVLQT